MDYRSDGSPHNKKYSTISGKLVARKRIYTVWVIKSDHDNLSMFFCPDCRNAIAQYKGDIVMEVPGMVQSNYPVVIQCKNPNCGRKVMFQGSVEFEL